MFAGPLDVQAGCGNGEGTGQELLTTAQPAERHRAGPVLGGRWNLGSGAGFWTVDGPRLTLAPDDSQPGAEAASGTSSVFTQWAATQRLGGQAVSSWPQAAGALKRSPFLTPLQEPEVFLVGEVRGRAPSQAVPREKRWWGPETPPRLPACPLLLSQRLVCGATCNSQRLLPGPGAPQCLLLEVPAVSALHSLPAQGRSGRRAA